MKKLLFFLFLVPVFASAQAVKVGDILCVQGSDTLMVHPEEYTDGAIGVVFYVDETGEHGWILHPQIQAEGFGVLLLALTSRFWRRVVLMKFVPPQVA